MFELDRSVTVCAQTKLDFLKDQKNLKLEALPPDRASQVVYHGAPVSHRPRAVDYGIFLVSESGASSKVDITNLRLTCKHFEKLASVHPTSCATIGHMSKRFAMIESMSMHPAVSKSIKQLTYISSKYVEEKIAEVYESISVLDERVIFHEFAEVEDLQPEETLRLYNIRHADQVEMEGAKAKARLCEALKRMPNIEKIKLIPRGFFNDDNWARGIRFWLFPQPAYDKSFLYIVRVLSLAGVRPREMEIKAIDCALRSGICSATFRQMTASDLSHCYNVYGSIRNLTISIWSFVDSWTTTNFVKILSCAVGLEVLRIAGNSTRPHLALTEFLSAPIWTSLTSLGLHGVNLDQKDLGKLLVRHARTLKKLRLSLVDVENWKNFLGDIKSSSVSLEFISIKDPSEKDQWGKIRPVKLNLADLKEFSK